MDPEAAASKDSSAYAVKVAYAGVKDLTVSAAYSSTDDDGTLRIANVATDTNGRYNSASSTKFAAQTKLYTEASWNYGYVGAAGADTVTLAAAYNAGFAKFTAQYTDVTAKAAGASASTDLKEVCLVASKSFGPLDVTLDYISADATDQNNAKRYDTVQAYLTLNF